MKICHYLPSLRLDDGGPPRSVSYLCSELVDRGISVSIITSDRRNDPEIQLNPKINRVNITNTLDLIKYLKAEKFNVAHQHGIWLPDSHRFTACVKKFEIPLVLSPRGMLQSWARNHKRFKKFIAWNLYQKNDLNKVDYFHVTSEDEASNLIALGFRENIRIIQNGVKEPAVESAKELPKKERNLVFLSRINQKKGLDLLLDAWAQIHAPGWNLLIAGNDDDNSLPKLKKRANQLDLKGRVQFLGSFGETEKARLYGKADLFILPSHSENFGIVVAEALSYGVPTITTKGCPWQELEEYNCGWWISLSVSNLKKAIVESVKLSDQERHTMGQNGQALFKRKYTWNHVVKEFENFYSKLINYPKMN